MIFSFLPVWTAIKQAVRFCLHIMLTDYYYLYIPVIFSAFFYILPSVP